MPIEPGDSYRLHKHDAVDWLRTLQDCCIDLVVTDPPYESLEKHRAIGTTTRLKHSKSSSNDWFTVFHNERFEELFTEVFRVLKKDRHFYLFCDSETMFVAKPIAERAGFKFWKPLIWNKQKIGMGYHYRAKYECILFFEKGKRKLSDLGVPDILDVPRIHGGYPTEKPVELLSILVEQSTRPGELVADPFMGSAYGCRGHRLWTPVPLAATPPRGPIASRGRDSALLRARCHVRRRAHSLAEVNMTEPNAKQKRFLEALRRHERKGTSFTVESLAMRDRLDSRRP